MLITCARALLKRQRPLWTQKLSALVVSLMFCSGLVACGRPARHIAPITQLAENSDIQPGQPNLGDLWDDSAEFVLVVEDTGLPMGESDTVTLGDGQIWSFVHASYRSLGVVDQCGDPVEFPGCVVHFESKDEGLSFQPTSGASDILVCMLPCAACPCESERDHIDQQQYPRLMLAGGPAATDASEEWLMTYEYRGNTFLLRSRDGQVWSRPEHVPHTGIWHKWLMACHSEEEINPHPNTPDSYECLVGSPPGIYIEDSGAEPELFVFVGLGQNPGSMGCFRGPLHADTSLLRKCIHNPLFTGASTYGPAATSGPDADAHFDFRTISSADVTKVDDHYYMFYEGVRGPEPGAAGDTQFALGLARSEGPAIDGPWEPFPHNPILLGLPGNVGIGHADSVKINGTTVLYTSVDGETRSRFELRWK